MQRGRDGAVGHGGLQAMGGGAVEVGKGVRPTPLHRLAVNAQVGPQAFGTGTDNGRKILAELSLRHRTQKGVAHVIMGNILSVDAQLWPSYGGHHHGHAGNEMSQFH